MDPKFNHDAVRALVEAAGRELTGDWLPVGGAVAAVWFESGRLTEDIDLIGIQGGAADRLALMEFAVGRRDALLRALNGG